MNKDIKTKKINLITNIQEKINFINSDVGTLKDVEKAAFELGSLLYQLNSLSNENKKMIH